MRSVTSYFNPTLYRKNLARFWPLWTAWTVLWLFLMPLNLLNDWRTRSLTGEEGLYRFYRECLNLNTFLTDSMIALGLVYCALVVMAVYGYLFNHRSAAALHALPLRRESLFITNFLSGFTFIALPHVVVYLLTALVIFTTLSATLSAVALSCLFQGFWMGLGALFFLYSFAVFCAQFTGNVLALPAFYAILNVLVVGMYTLCTEMANQIFYGGWPLVGQPRWVELFTPVYALSEACRWTRVPIRDVWDTERKAPVFKALMTAFEDPALVAGYVVAGIALAGVALLLYRRRHIETAGDVVSVKAVRPIFWVGVSVCAGLCGGIVTSAFFGWLHNEILMLLSVAVWAVVGYFAAEMLLQKSFRVLKKGWKGCVLTTAVLVLLVAGCLADVFGIETWVPEAEEVEGITVNINSLYPYDKASGFHLDLEDTVSVQRITGLHQAILDDYAAHGKQYFGDDMMYFRVNYRMNSGMEYSKQYSVVNIVQNEIDIPGTTSYRLNEFVNDPGMLYRAYGMDSVENARVVNTRLENVRFKNGALESVESLLGGQEIWDAVQADFAAGNLGRRYLVDDNVRRTQTYMTDLTLHFWVPEEEWGAEEAYYYDYDYAPTVVSEYDQDTGLVWNRSMDITLTPDARRTIAALERYYDLGGAFDLAEHDLFSEPYPTK